MMNESSLTWYINQVGVAKLGSNSQQDQGIKTVS